ncbi:MAG TPA: tRNA uridine-5-carboxymethylaminomethyl(34) synthesis enzyme MnmG [Chitinophagaceae bacterium]|nr:tRNA uridine-5-carboxymethylaminomethyl(34) synthesis enzyme MnmG [Chitinophagaceae bacterium]
MNLSYNIIVVGAGHAGCEAAMAAANLGAKVLLITMDMTKMAQMSCNPAMGGIAKGQIVREIDALGGQSGIVTDLSMIQFRMLNRSKGPAVWSPRAQCDRTLFTLEWRKIIESNRNIDVWQDSVVDLDVSNGRVVGVGTRMSVRFLAEAVILTVGTFGNGLMHIGRVQMSGGRIGEKFSQGITEKLQEYGIEAGRLKTGTPARLDGRTIDFGVLAEQKGDDEIRRFSFLETTLPERQLSCYIAFTNQEVHDVLREGFGDSPLYGGIIEGIGPRYCPSIEDKIVTFASKESHQLFLEPEGWNTNEYYINGFSSSLPLDVQFKALRKIVGLEHVKIYRPGYAIEYDYYLPTQLFHSLETKKIENLFFAGQINGTTGYEEAAAQGLMAGINAFRKINGENALVLKRDEAYIGVLIDDLVTKGVDEPYRMFTSRAEYRVLLRQDNADERLTDIGIEKGLVKEDRKKIYLQKKNERKAILDFFRGESISPEQINPFLTQKGSSEIRQKVKLYEILLRPEITCFELLQATGGDNRMPGSNAYYTRELLESIEVELKYKGYIERDRLLADKVGRLDGIRIMENIDFDSLLSISTEGRQKLKRYKPGTIGQAARISGISPSDINVLLLYMGR